MLLLIAGKLGETLALRRLRNFFSVPQIFKNLVSAP